MTSAQCLQRDNLENKIFLLSFWTLKMDKMD